MFPRSTRATKIDRPEGPATDRDDATGAGRAGIRIRRTVASLAVAVMAAGMVLATSATAGAATNDAGGFDCLGPTSAGGIVESGPLNEPYANRNTTYEVLLGQYTTGGWKWFWMHTGTGATSYTMNDLGGQYGQPVFSINVPHGYYTVDFEAISTGDSAWHYVPATIYKGYGTTYTSSICKV